MKYQLLDRTEVIKLLQEQSTHVNYHQCSATDLPSIVDNYSSKYIAIWDEVDNSINELPLLISAPSHDAHEDLVAWVSTFIGSNPQFTNVCAIETHDVTREWVQLKYKQIPSSYYRFGLGLILSELLLSNANRNSTFTPNLRLAQRTLTYVFMRGYTLGYSSVSMQKAKDAFENIKTSSKDNTNSAQSLINEMLEGFWNALYPNAKLNSITYRINEVINIKNNVIDTVAFLSKVSGFDEHEIQKIIELDSPGTKEQRLKKIENLVATLNTSSSLNIDSTAIFGYLYASLAKGNFSYLEQIGIKDPRSIKISIWFILFTAIDPDYKIEICFDSLGLSLLMNLRENFSFPNRSSLEISLEEFLIKTQRLKINPLELARYANWGYRLALLPGISIPLRNSEETLDRVQAENNPNQFDRNRALEQALNQILSIAMKFKESDLRNSNQLPLFYEKPYRKPIRPKPTKKIE